MKKPVLVGILIVAVVLGVIIYSSLNLASHRYEACMTFNGQTNCRTASGSTEQFAMRTAISNAAPASLQALQIPSPASNRNPPSSPS